MRNCNKFHLLDYSELSTAVNNEYTARLISDVLDMVDTTCAKPQYALTANNITVEESVHCEVVNGVKINNFTAAMQKGRYRFFLFDNEFNSDIPYINTEYGFTKCMFSIKSKVKDSVNNFFTYFISNDVAKNEQKSMALIMSIIANKMNTMLESNGVIIERAYTEHPVIDNNNYNEINSCAISTAKFILIYWNTLFETIDRVVGLKYDDFDSIIDIAHKIIGGDITAIFTGDDDGCELLRHIYNNAITIPRDAADDNKLFKELYAYLLGVEQ